MSERAVVQKYMVADFSLFSKHEVLLAGWDLFIWSGPQEMT